MKGRRDREIAAHFPSTIDFNVAGKWRVWVPETPPYPDTATHKGFYLTAPDGTEVDAWFHTARSAVEAVDFILRR